MNVCINKNVELCKKAALNESNEVYARESDIALIESKMAGMNQEDKERANRTISDIKRGIRRYSDGVFSSKIAGVPRKFN